MAERKTNIYLKNSDLLAETIASKEAGKMSNRLAEMLTLLVSRYARLRKFSGYSYREDMEAHALYSLCKTWQRFDETQWSNAFGYYSKCVENAFIQVLNAEKKHRNIRDKLLVEHGMDPSFTYTEDQKSSSPTDDKNKHYEMDMEY